MPRFILPRVANFITNAVVVVDGAREVRGRTRLLSRLKRNNNCICLLDTEGFALRDDALHLRYPSQNTNFIDYILTWGCRTHDKLSKMGLKEKLVKFGSPQFAYFENIPQGVNSECGSQTILVNTAFPAADIISDSISLGHDRIKEAREIRSKFIKFISNNFHRSELELRVHPNEQPDFYKDLGFKIKDNRKLHRLRIFSTQGSN